MDNLTKNRFVAVLDILGFKDRVLSHSHKELYSKLEELIDITMTNNELIGRMRVRNYKPLVFNFSDSFFVFSTDDSAESFDVFLNFTQALFMNAIGLSFMIKGAIGYGQITINEEKKIYFGKPIIDAYLLQEDVKFLGIVFHHIAETRLREIGNPNNAYKLDSIPSSLATGKIEHLNLLWFMTTDMKMYHLAIDDMENLRKTCSGYPRLYIDNTIKMIQEYVQNTCLVRA